MEEQFVVSKVKCQGCVSNIKNGLGEMAGINHIDVDVTTGQVVVQGDALNRGSIALKLAELGYPEV